MSLDLNVSRMDKARELLKQPNFSNMGGRERHLVWGFVHIGNNPLGRWPLTKDEHDEACLIVDCEYFKLLELTA